MIHGLARELNLPVNRLPIWRPKFTPELLRLRKSQNERAYRRGFQQQAIDDSEKLFPSFRGCVRYGEDWRSRLSDAVYATGMDISGEGRKGTWIVGGAIRPDGTRVIGEGMVRRGAWTLLEALEALDELDRLYAPIVHVVENNASQKYLIDSAKIDKGKYPFWGKLVGQHTGSDKHSVEVGLPSLEILFANRQYEIHFDSRHAVSCDCDLCELVKQFDQYPNGEADDGVMATWKLEHGLRNYGQGRVVIGMQGYPVGTKREELIEAERERRLRVLEKVRQARGGW